MADANPTGGGDVVAITIPPDNQKFLRCVFEAALNGIRDDLTNYPDQLQEPTRVRREEAVYERLLAALDCGSIVPDCDVRHLLNDLAQMIDRENEYARVIAEHAALLGLRDQLAGGRKR